jgi:hypothetical protein
VITLLKGVKKINTSLYGTLVATDSQARGLSFFSKKEKRTNRKLQPYLDKPRQSDT